MQYPKRRRNEGERDAPLSGEGQAKLGNLPTGSVGCGEGDEGSAAAVTGGGAYPQLWGPRHRGTK